MDLIQITKWSEPDEVIVPDTIKGAVSMSEWLESEVESYRAGGRKAEIRCQKKRTWDKVTKEQKIVETNKIALFANKIA